MKSVERRASIKIRIILIAAEGKQGRSARKQGDLERSKRKSGG